TAAVTSSYYMFQDCTNLVGGKGTTYDANHIDATYAHIDGGPSNPGYFTEKGPEAYACYTPSNTTLTFYYDSQRSSRTGTSYVLNTGSNDPGWETDGTNVNVTKVVFDPSFANARPTTTWSWFSNMGNLQSITGLEYLNTSEVTNMAWMFTHCNDLTSLDLSNFNTSNVDRMTCMFYGCYNLRTIYVGNGWSTAAVTYSSDMFTGCTSLVGGQGTTWNDSNPKDKTYAHIDGGPSNPGYFTDKNAPVAYACYTPSNTTLTFYYDNQRSSRTGTTYDLNTGSNDTGWDTDDTKYNVTKVVFDPSFAGARPTTTCDWFYCMYNLESITGMSYLNTSEVTNMKWMFMECYKLTSLDLSHFNTSKVIYMNQMFQKCTGLTSLDLSHFNTSKVTYMNKMFEGSTNLRTIYVGSGWSTAAVTSSTNMFNNCTSLVGGQGTTWNSSNPTDKTYAHIDGGPSNPGYFTDGNGPRPYACYTSSNTTLTFYYDNQRSSRTGTTYDLNTGDDDTGWLIDGTYANVTRVVFDASFANARPTTTSRWFYIMQNLESITGMEYLNTSEVTNMAYMFYFCIKLTSLDVSHFNTSKVTDMGAMFRNCSSLTSLDLSSFNTSKVTNMLQMFYYCSSLTNLDLSSFNTSKVTDMRYMFYGSSNLRTIYVGSGWNTATVTTSDYMFYNCTSLVGGQGTTWNSSNPTDKAYAHIDGGPSNPGYFTAKNAGLRGDVDSDGNVTIGDVSALIDYLLNGASSGVTESSADVDLDGNVTIGDVSALTDYLLNGFWN
ncbi:MAG: BspA family leucine-rich repeat surface protein, partial [Muribaculaceae bacterium]|nr:BspA family leucine-rich repeat surface protein [Muribaculaceae bacterium]